MRRVSFIIYFYKRIPLYGESIETYIGIYMIGESGYYEYTYEILQIQKYEQKMFNAVYISTRLK